jgi:hypothetical protein
VTKLFPKLRNELQESGWVGTGSGNGKKEVQRLHLLDIVVRYKYYDVVLVT